MHTQLLGFKRRYAAEHPNSLLSILESQKRNLTQSLPDFTAIYNLKGSKVTYAITRAWRQYVQLYMDTLNDVVGDEDYLVITDQEQWFKLDEKVWMKYIEKRAKLRINTRLLVTDSKLSQQHKKLEENFHEQIRFLPTGAEFDVDLLITPKRLIIFQTKLPYTAIEIPKPSCHHYAKKSV